MDYSAIESDVLGLKVGRAKLTRLDVDELRKSILTERYDLCRLSLPSELEVASSQLHALGMPFYFSGSIRRYKTAISELQERPYNHSDTVYERLDDSKSGLLFDMLKGCWGTYPIGYYRTPYIRELTTIEQEIECVHRFYLKQNNSPEFPGNTIMFMRNNGVYVGFFALNVNDDILESHIGGILGPYQKDGHFVDMQEYIRRFCLDNGLRYFCFGARNENSRVQSIFNEFGYRAYGTENVFHILPLLSATTSKPVSRIVQMNWGDTFRPGGVILGLVNEALAKRFSPASLNNMSFLWNNAPELQDAAYRIRVSFPIMDRTVCFASILMYPEDSDAVVGWGSLTSNRAIISRSGISQ